MNRRRWWIGTVLALVAILAASAGVAWYVQSGLARWLVLRQLEALTDRHVTIERLDLDLAHGRLQVAGLRLADRTAGPPLAEIDRVDVRFRPLALLRGRLTIHEAALDGVRARLVRSERGELNIADLRVRKPAKRSTDVTVDHLTLSGGEVSLEDRFHTPVHAWRVEGLAMEISHLSTTPSDTQGTGRITATVGGAPVSAEIADLRLAPLHFRGRLAVRDVDAAIADIFLPADMRAVVERGRLAVELTMSVDARAGIGLDATGRLDDLGLRNRRNADPLAAVPFLAFTVSGAHIDSSGLAPRLGRIEVTGAATLFHAKGSSAGRFEVDRVRLQIADVGGDSPAPARVSLDAGLPGGGNLDVQGTLRLGPLGAELRARVTRLESAVLVSYFDLPMPLSGVVETDLTVTLAYSSALITRVRGRAAVSRATVADSGREVVRVERLEAEGIEVDGVGAQWPKVGVKRVRLLQPVAVVERDQAGHIPLADRFSSAPRAPGQGTTGKTAAAPAMTVEIAEITMDDGTVTLDDAVATPPARLTLAKLRGSARNVVWPASRPVAIDLRAATPGAGTLEANGTVSLDPFRLDVRARLAGAALAPYQGYIPFPARIEGAVHADVAITGTLGSKVEVTAKGTAGLSDLAMADGKRRVMRVSRVETTGLEYTWPATLTVDRLHVGRSRVRVERQADGAFPLRALFTPARRPETTGTGEQGPAPQSARPAIAVTVRAALLEDGAAHITDATVTPAARIDLSGVRLVAHGFTWPARSPLPIELRVGTPGGGRVSARGALDLASAGADLDVTVDDVDVAPARPYLPLRGQITGKVGAKLKVNATLEPLVLTARGMASLAELSVTKAEQRVFTAAHSTVTGLEYAWPATVSIDRLRIQRPWAVIDRVLGKLPLLDALTLGDPTTASSTRPPTPAPSAAPLLQLGIRRSIIEDGAATIVDASVSPAERLEITGARVTLRDLAWPPHGPSSLVARLSTPEGGTIEARGQLGLDPSSIDTRLALKGIDLATWQPLVPGRARIAGKTTAELQIKGPLAPLDLSITGQMAVTDGSLGDGQRALLTAKRVDVSGLAATWPRRQATIQRIAIREPWALVERDASGKLPLLSLFTPEQPDGATAATSDGPARIARTEDKASLEVGALAVEEGFVRFTDHTTTPAFVEEASRLAVTARGLGMAPATRSKLTVTARLTGGAQVELNGTMGPLGGPLFADVDGKLSGLALNRVNPYVNGLVGWIARKGSVGATTRFRIRDDRLEADSTVVIAQPEFVPSRRGDEVRKRVGVPLDLLVSLLENSQHEVHLSVPVTGTLSSHQFDFGDAVWAAIRKAAIKVLALPLSWVGEIFYTADSRIDAIAIWPVSFEPGTTRMRRGIDTHAARLATFMRERPAVAFTLKPVMTVEDVDALKRDSVRQHLDSLARGAGQPDAAAVAARLFAERFPGRPVPAELDRLVSELAKEEPSPDRALRALATERVDLTRRELEGKGVEPGRLRASEGVVPVESSGAGRVEFEMTSRDSPTS